MLPGDLPNILNWIRLDRAGLDDVRQSMGRFVGLAECYNASFYSTKPSRVLRKFHNGNRPVHEGAEWSDYFAARVHGLDVAIHSVDNADCTSGRCLPHHEMYVVVGAGMGAPFEQSLHARALAEIGRPFIWSIPFDWPSWATQRPLWKPVLRGCQGYRVSWAPTPLVREVGELAIQAMDASSFASLHIRRGDTVTRDGTPISKERGCDTRIPAVVAHVQRRLAEQSLASSEEGGQAGVDSLVFFTDERSPQYLQDLEDALARATGLRVFNGELLVLKTLEPVLVSRGLQLNLTDNYLKYSITRVVRAHATLQLSRARFCRL